MTAFSSIWRADRIGNRAVDEENERNGCFGLNAIVREG